MRLFSSINKGFYELKWIWCIENSQKDKDGRETDINCSKFILILSVMKMILFEKCTYYIPHNDKSSLHLQTHLPHQYIASCTMETQMFLGKTS